MFSSFSRSRHYKKKSTGTSSSESHPVSSSSSSSSHPSNISNKNKSSKRWSGVGAPPSKKAVRVPSATSSTIDDPLQEFDGDDSRGGGSIHGVRSLIGISSGISLDGQSLMLPPSVVYQTPGGGGGGAGSVTTATTTGAGGPLGEAPSPTQSDLYSYTLSPSHQTFGDDDNHDFGGHDPPGDDYEVDDDDDHSNRARIMMGMSHPPGMIIAGGNADEEAPSSGLIQEGESGEEEMASSSASALFDGRSLQISASPSDFADDDVSSMNSQSLYQGGIGYSPSPIAATDAARAAATTSTTPASLVSVSSLPQTPQEDETNRYLLGPYGRSSKLRIVGSVSLTNDDTAIAEGGGGNASRSSRGNSKDVEEGTSLGADKSSDAPSGWCCCRCAPAWIQRAPSWLKIVLAASMVLIVLAIVVVAVAVGFALHDRASASTSNVNNTNGVSVNNSTLGGGSTPSYPANATLAPDPPPTGNETGADGGSGTDAPPLENSTDAGSGTGNSDNTTGWSDLVRMSFAATAGRYPDELAQQIPALLPNFTSTKTVTAAVDGGGQQVTEQQADDDGGGNDAVNGDVESLLQFVAHLGDWNSPEYTGCDGAAYQDIADLFTASTVPVYFVPGDNEYNDCTDQEEEALNRWRDTFIGYVTSNWNVPWSGTQSRQDELPENFVFVFRQIIFVGLNLVSGNVYDQDVWDERLALDLEWVTQAYDTWHNETRAMVLFSHSSPDNSLSAAFFEPFMEEVGTSWTDLEFIVLHRSNPGVQEMEQTLQYGGIDNLQVISVLGSTWPPLRATVTIDRSVPAGPPQDGGDRRKAVTVQVEQDIFNYLNAPQE